MRSKNKVMKTWCEKVQIENILQIDKAFLSGDYLFLPLILSFYLFYGYDYEFKAFYLLFFFLIIHPCNVIKKACFNVCETVIYLI